MYQDLTGIYYETGHPYLGFGRRLMPSVFQTFQSGKLAAQRLWAPARDAKCIYRDGRIAFLISHGACKSSFKHEACHENGAQALLYDG